MFKTEFKPPDFTESEIEFRFEDNEVCIYATDAGLKKLAECCNKLLDNPKKGHIHLEDTGMLTEKSLKAALAIFGKNRNIP